MSIKVSMHNWMRPEPIEHTIERLARLGYDGIEISGEPQQLRRRARARAARRARARVLGRGDADDRRPRPAARGPVRAAAAASQYVKDCLTLRLRARRPDPHASCPSTVGKIVPMGSAADEWALVRRVAASECQAHAESVGVRIGAGAAEPLRDVLPQPLRAGAGAGRRGRRRLRRRARRVPHEHRGVRPAGRDPRRGRPARRLPRRRQQPHAARATARSTGTRSCASWSGSATTAT